MPSAGLTGNTHKTWPRPQSTNPSVGDSPRKQILAQVQVLGSRGRVLLHDAAQRTESRNVPHNERNLGMRGREGI